MEANQRFCFFLILKSELFDLKLLVGQDENSCREDAERRLGGCVNRLECGDGWTQAADLTESFRAGWWRRSLGSLKEVL